MENCIEAALIKEQIKNNNGIRIQNNIKNLWKITMIELKMEEGLVSN